MKTINLKNVTKKLAGREVLSDISYEFRAGQIYGLKGKNGCGKTMLMRSIAGPVEPTYGTVTIDGKVLYKDIDVPLSMGLLIENPKFYDNWSAVKNLVMLEELRGEYDIEEIRSCIKSVGLDPDDKRTVKKFSLGMKQRLGIAAATVGMPELVLLDEPINAIDGQGVQNMTEYIKSLKSDDRIIIIACHDENEMNILADTIINMSEGKIMV